MTERRGTTLVELVIILSVIGVLLAITLPVAGASLDSAAVRGAAQDVEAQFAAAREQALARNAVVWLVLDDATATVRVRIPGAGTRSRAVGSIYGVALRSTRDSMSYDGRGLGRGAANLTVVLTRGRARATLVVSRLGRVRR